MSMDSLDFFTLTLTLGDNAQTLQSGISAGMNHKIVSGTTDLARRFRPRASPLEGVEPTLDSFADDLYTILIQALRSRQATDEHDLIYGVLGMTRLPDLPSYLVPERLKVELNTQEGGELGILKIFMNYLNFKQ